MKSAITISLVPEARSGPFVFHDGLADGCARAAALGFDGVEIFPPSAAAIDRAELRGSLGKYPLQIAAVGTGGGWVAHRWHLLHADAAVREKARAFIHEIIEVAADFGAPAILGSMQGRVEGELMREQALEWLAAALEEFGAHAAERGQAFIYEPLNRYETNLFNRLGDAAEFLDALTSQHVKLLADLFHMNIEEASIPAAIRGAARHLGHVHFADSNRHAIGHGHTDVLPIVEALRDVGYAGYLSGEIFPLPDSDAAARQTIASFRAFTR